MCVCVKVVGEWGFSLVTSKGVLIVPIRVSPIRAEIMGSRRGWHGNASWEREKQEAGGLG